MVSISENLRYNDITDGEYAAHSHHGLDFFQPEAFDVVDLHGHGRVIEHDDFLTVSAVLPDDLCWRHKYSGFVLVLAKEG